MRNVLIVFVLSLCCGGLAHADDKAPQPKPPEEIDRGDGMVLHFYRSNFVAPAELQRQLVALVKGRGRLHVMAQQGTLAMEGDPRMVKRMLAALAHLDVAPRQVLVEAKVSVVTHVEAQGSVLRPKPAAAADEAPKKSPDVVVLGDEADPDHVVTTLKTTGAVEVVARASVLATMGHQAQVTQESQHSLLRTSEVRAADTVHRATSLRTALTLKVLPVHIGESFVTLEIEPEIHGLRDATPLETNSLEPTATIHRARTTVTIKLGESVVIAGLFSQRATQQGARPAVIVNRPMGGTAGPRATEGSVRTEVVLTITPKAVSSPTPAASKPR